MAKRSLMLTSESNKIDCFGREVLILSPSSFDFSGPPVTKEHIEGSHVPVAQRKDWSYLRDFSNAFLKVSAKKKPWNP